MNRPERICTNENSFDRGYNIACDDWEAYLPTEAEIERIILDWQEDIEKKNKEKVIHIYQSDRLAIAKAIHERISK